MGFRGPEFGGRQFESRLNLPELTGRAKEVLQRGAMNRHDFVDLYGPGKIEADDATVARIEHSIDERRRHEDEKMEQMATIFEAILHEQGPAWLGDPRIALTRTDRYDDFVNHVDEVLSVPLEVGHSNMALSVDVTFSQYQEKNLESILESIRAGKLGSIRYFKQGNFRGELTHVPRVILCASGSLVEHLANQWAKNNPNFGSHHFRYLVMEELRYQLEAFGRYAGKVKRPAEQKAYTDALTLVQGLGKKLPPIREEQRDVLDDRLFTNVKKMIEQMV